MPRPCLSPTDNYRYDIADKADKLKYEIYEKCFTWHKNSISIFKANQLIQFSNNKVFNHDENRCCLIVVSEVHSNMQLVIFCAQKLLHIYIVKLRTIQFLRNIILSHKHVIKLISFHENSFQIVSCI